MDSFTFPQYGKRKFFQALCNKPDARNVADRYVARLAAAYPKTFHTKDGAPRVFVGEDFVLNIAGKTERGVYIYWRNVNDAYEPCRALVDYRTDLPVTVTTTTFDFDGNVEGVEVEYI